ncbi:NADPH-dependent F420 reductase [Methanospirillum stamsii]|uniref:NADPH-dependent F420 reductase n=2 Tax=Methanospirillum stamsii TaxID=1277351 RepID=A0A2V2MPZ2_9EURY|nr:NADPH-dependent F420 reductase [Methanospirillum stamsii]PWR70294.1 NADPH-dependent F420 reductase [Methanospirillum stamsii]
MKIGIIGGTGDIGEGLALRVSDKHEIILGSRDPAKAVESADKIKNTLKERGIDGNCRGTTNEDAAKAGDMVVISLPFQHVAPTLAGINPDCFKDKIVISPVNPMVRKNGCFLYCPPDEGSAALAIKKMLPESCKLVTAFNNIAARKWSMLDCVLDYTVAVTSDDTDAKMQVMALAQQISKLQPVDAGGLELAGIVESLTPLTINIAQNNKLKDLSIYMR